MGVYQLTKNIKEISQDISFPSPVIKTKEGKRKVASVALDIENMIPTCIYFKEVGSQRIKMFDIDKFINIYIKPFIQKRVFIIAVFGKEEPKCIEEVTTINEFLKLKKNIKKAYQNLDEREKEKKRKVFEDFFKNLPLSYDEKNEKIIDKMNTEEIQNSIEYFHWLTHSKSKRIEGYMIPKVRETLSRLGVPVVFADCEADEYCAKLSRCGAVDAIFTLDSDLMAMGCNMILDVNKKNMKIALYDDFMKYYQSEYTEENIKDAFAFSSADFNYILYNQRINFTTSLINIKEKGFYNYFKEKCEEFKLMDEYKEDTIKAIRECYDVSEYPSEDYNDILKSLCRSLVLVKVDVHYIRSMLPDVEKMIKSLFYLRVVLYSNLKNVIGVSPVKELCSTIFQIWTDIITKKKLKTLD